MTAVEGRAPFSGLSPELPPSTRAPDRPEQTRAALLGGVRPSAQTEQRAQQALEQLLQQQPGESPNDKLISALRAAGLNDQAIGELRDNQNNISLTAARKALLDHIKQTNPRAAQQLERAPLNQILGQAMRANGAPTPEQPAPGGRPPRTQRPPRNQRPAPTAPGGDPRGVRAGARPGAERRARAQPRREPRPAAVERDRPVRATPEATRATPQQVAGNINDFWRKDVPAGTHTRAHAEAVWTALRERPDALRHVDGEVMAAVNRLTPAPASELRAGP
ncbi:MAG: hypothetical protein ACAI38_15905 [Myxococcota bacterium]